MDKNDIIAALKNRTSAVTTNLGAPSPSKQDIMIMMECAVSAPDHGGLTPWRFAIIDPENFSDFENLVIKAKKHDNPNVTEAELATVIKKLRRAPTLVAVWVEKQNSKKIPMFEQISATAMASLQFMQAANALGYGAVFLSGWMIFNPLIKQSFGITDDDQFLGFMYLGTEQEPARSKNRPNPKDFLRIFKC